jgi:hypothetical protein
MIRFLEIDPKLLFVLWGRKFIFCIGRTGYNQAEFEYGVIIGNGCLFRPSQPGNVDR